MLNKIKLFVASRSGEVRPCDSIILFTRLTFCTKKSHATLPTKRRIGEHNIELFLRWREQAILNNDRTTPIIGDNTVEEEIHHTQTSRIIHNFPAIKSIVA